jgi:hypothetical protein
LAEVLSVLEAFESSRTDDSDFVGTGVLAADSVVAPAAVEAEPEFGCVVSIESFATLAPLEADGTLLASVFTTEPAFPSALTLLLRDG